MLYPQNGDRIVTIDFVTSPPYVQREYHTTFLNGLRKKDQSQPPFRTVGLFKVTTITFRTLHSSQPSSLHASHSTCSLGDSPTLIFFAVRLYVLFTYLLT